MTTRTTATELAKGPQAAFAPMTGEGERRLATTLFNLLAEGEPVEIGRLAQAAGRQETEVVADLAKPPFEPLVYRDRGGRVVGFGGLGVAALGETRHRLQLDGRELYAWCAEDALFLPIVLNREVRVESSCPVTGERISLTVSPEGFTDLEPSGAVMSFLDPPAFEARGEESWGGDVIRNGCHFIHFFASNEVAQAWISEHPGTLQLAIEDGFEVGRRWVAYAFGVGPDR
ncbi:MAG: organomercurial lyase [Solirubrobacterales bacterium]